MSDIGFGFPSMPSSGNVFGGLVPQSNWQPTQALSMPPAPQYSGPYQNIGPQQNMGFGQIMQPPPPAQFSPEVTNAINNDRTNALGGLMTGGAGTPFGRVGGANPGQPAPFTPQAPPVMHAAPFRPQAPPVMHAVQEKKGPTTAAWTAGWR